MRFEVELHPDLARILKSYRWPPEEVEAFFARLNEVCDDPIGQSEHVSEPDISRYILRFFRFGVRAEKIAIFGLDSLKAKIRVIKCRPLRGKQGGRGGKPVKGSGADGGRR